MIGAIIGDIAGSRFERENCRSKNFRIFHEQSRPTDDSVMSLAVAKAICEWEGGYEDLSSKAVSCMQELGRMYENAGYGGTFIQWIWSSDPKPYGSYGNGSAMRVGPCGFAAKSIEEAKALSAAVTKVTHDHPEGMKGAEAAAVSVFLAGSGKSREEIRDFVRQNYYDINFTIDELRPKYGFDVSCQGSVPVALEAFFESADFEDAIRTAVSVGGDSDTIAAITGAVAEAYYGVPEDFIEEAIEYLDAPEMEILYYFEKKYPSKAINEDSDVSVFDVIDRCVDKIIPEDADLFESDEPSAPSADGPGHVWLRKADLIPDFSSFTGKQNMAVKGSESKDLKKRARRMLNGAQKAAGHIGSKAVNAVKQAADNMGFGEGNSSRGEKEPKNAHDTSSVKENVQVEVIDDPELMASTDYEKSLFEITNELDMLSSHADKWDYFAAVASGLLCGMTDVLWVGDFDLMQGRDIASEKIDNIVIKTAKMFGCKSGELKDSAAFLEKMFPIPSDGNTPDLGGGLQHHLRDFGHHPTIVGLIFSLLTQFTEYSYGTDRDGRFIVVPVPERSRIFIGKDAPDKIFKGTVVWFFHLVSDIAGSSGSAGMGGGTGIPGPILSLAKEIAALKIFRDVKMQDHDLSEFLSKIFNGTIFAKHDKAGKIIKESVVRFDLRGEYGALIELGKQVVPVIANDVIVRTFYFIRRLAIEIKCSEAGSFADLKGFDWKACRPFDNPTVDRMVTIAAGVFSSVDIAGAVLSQTYWISVNYAGLGRFTVAVGKEMTNFLRKRDVKKIKNMYEQIRRNVFCQFDNRIYERLEKGMNNDKFGLTLEETEILYNLEYHKTLNDVRKTTLPVGGDQVAQLKNDWIAEWKSYMERGFSGFTGIEDAALHWYTLDELLDRINANDPEKVWFRIVLLEAMLFEPYYPLSFEKTKKGKKVPSSKYRNLKNPIFAYKKAEGDEFLENCFIRYEYYQPGYIKRLRRCYNKVLLELNEVMKIDLKAITVLAAIAIVVAASAGMFAPAIAVALVGSNFAGLSGAALTSACLAYIGGGAVASGGIGMAGGIIAIAGGGSVLGIGAGAGIGGAVRAYGLMEKKETIRQSAKLMVSVREIFLNDEHDIAYSDSVYEQYVQNIENIEKGLVELKLKEKTANKEEKKRLQKEIKNTEDSVRAMEVAMKSMNRYMNSFKAGLDSEN